MNKSGRNERVVSLTQSEIMLVLAVVILLLLLVKNADFAKVRDAVMGAESPQSAAQEILEPPPLEREVVDTLVRKAEAGRAVLNALGVDDAADADAAREVVEELKLRAEAAGQSQIEGAELQRKNEELRDDLQAQADDNELLREQLREQKTGGEEARAANEELRAENEQLQKNSKNLQLTIDDLQGQLREKGGADELADADALRDKIGCLPCWLGDGRRLYYKTYDITYDKNGRFLVKLHSDLRSDAAVVKNALAGELRVIYDYPALPVTRGGLLQFANKINAAKNNAHGEECRLAVDLNEKADGTIVKFLLHEAKFCPIYK